MNADGASDSPLSFASLRATRIATVTGATGLIVGLLANQWLLGRILGSGGAVSDPADRLIIWIFQGVLVTWGVMNLAFRRRAIVAKLNLMLASLVLISPLLAEVALRIAIAARVPAVCDAGLYADALSEDDHWKLRHVWSGAGSGDRVVQDLQLGWAPPKDQRNPLGVYSPTTYELNNRSPAVLFFGDSFVDSPAGIENAIPAIMDQQMPDTTVFNFGVSGYGVDQIYLRLKSASSAFQNQTLLFGVLTSDLDRSVLTFRGAPKPYFKVEDGGLVAHRLDKLIDVDEWIREHPPQIRSFLLAFAKMRFRLHQPGEFREHRYRREEKQQVNRAILSAAMESNAPEAPIVFVLFYEPEELKMEGWREQFLLEEMRRLDAKFLDTKPLLLAEAAKQDSEIGDFYRSDHHLNRRGNEVVARALVKMLTERE